MNEWMSDLKVHTNWTAHKTLQLYLVLGSRIDLRSKGLEARCGRAQRFGFLDTKADDLPVKILILFLEPPQFLWLCGSDLAPKRRSKHSGPSIGMITHSLLNSEIYYCPRFLIHTCFNRWTSFSSSKSCGRPISPELESRCRALSVSCLNNCSCSSSRRKPSITCDQHGPALRSNEKYQ